MIADACSRSRVFTALVLAAPLAAAAHVTSDGVAHHGFLAGFLHPFTGVDHLLAMVAVGLWSAGTAPVSDWRRYAMAPLAFASLLLAGAVAAGHGMSLPAIEPMIAASVLVLGLLVAARQRLPALAGAALVGAFALFHGAAHGQELVGAGALAAMVSATVVLHIAGMGIGHLLRTASIWWPRTLGVGLVLAGGGLLLG